VRNIELKARLADLAAARLVAASVATRHVGTQQQVDTYFDCRQGRLKLREIDGRSAQLVWYARADRSGPKASDYRLVPVDDPVGLKAALSEALGVRVIVEKRREIFLVDNVRIHLDEVVGLGDFLEFEAVLGPQCDDRDGHLRVDELATKFGLAEADLVRGSYADLLGSNS